MKTSELKELIKRATNGPWIEGDKNCDSGARQIVSQKDYVCVIRSLPDDEANEYENEKQSKANAALIALTPDLAAEVIRLREALIEICIETSGSYPSHIGQDRAYSIARAALTETEG